MERTDSAQRSAGSDRIDSARLTVRPDQSAYIQIADGVVRWSVRVGDGAYVDFTADGSVAGIEVADIGQAPDLLRFYGYE